jgi:hypothetical protein
MNIRAASIIFKPLRLTPRGLIKLPSSPRFTSGGPMTEGLKRWLDEKERTKAKRISRAEHLVCTLAKGTT